MPIAIEAAVFAIGLLCMLLIWGTGYLKQLLTNWNVGWLPIKWVFNAATALPLQLLQGMENLILPALAPLKHFFDNTEKAAATFVTGIVNYVLHLNDKTNANHRAAGYAGAAAKTAQKDYGSLLHHVNGLVSVAPVAKVANTTAANLKAFEHHLDAVVLPGIHSSISAAVHQAEASSKDNTKGAIASQSTIFHHTLINHWPIGLPIPTYAETTIPIALAGIIAQVAALEAEATTCWNPMCSDWNLAKDVLATLGLTLGAAGAISFLVEAITNPVGTAGAVADIGLGLEETAVSTLANILGINIGGAGD